MDLAPERKLLCAEVGLVVETLQPTRGAVFAALRSAGSQTEVGIFPFDMGRPSHSARKRCGARWRLSSTKLSSSSATRNESPPSAR